MLVNYWYVARSSEIFLDLDDRRSLTRAMRVLHVWMKRPKSLRFTAFNTVGWGLPTIDKVYHYPTLTAGHCHVVVVLNGLLTEDLRATLALWMGSDRLRTAYVLERQRFGLGEYADLLGVSRLYHREPDATCECKKKHKHRRVTEKCHALKMLLGSHRSADYFPRVGHKPIPALRVPVGEVPLNMIKKWRNENGKANA